MPGAVPSGLGIGWLPRGNMACTTFRSGMGRLRRANNSRMCASDPSSSTRSVPANRAKASRVRSSAVGPRPPLAITTSARSTACRNTTTFSSRSSATVVWQTTRMPRSSNRWLSHWLLVSSRWPVVISSPIEITSACTGSSQWFEEFTFGSPPSYPALDRQVIRCRGSGSAIGVSLKGARYFGAAMQLPGLFGGVGWTPLLVMPVCGILQTHSRV